MSNTKKLNLGLLSDNNETDFSTDNLFDNWLNESPLENNDVVSENASPEHPSRFDQLFNTEPVAYNKKPSSRKVFSNLDKFNFKKDLNIKILGIGGAGNNMIAHMANNSSIEKSFLYAINTDYQVLRNMPDTINTILIGNKITNGHGSGSDPEIGKQAALEDESLIREILEGTDLLFIVSGMGKGTGTGASPVICEIARQMGILTLSLVNLPSITNEGSLIFKKGENGLRNLMKYTNGILTISNEKLFNETSSNISLLQAFNYANSVISNVIYEIINLISVANKINVDFNDVKTFFKEQTSFQLNTFSFNDEKNIEESIIEQLKWEIYQDNLKGAKKAIINLKLNPSVTRDFIKSFQSALFNVTNNSDLDSTLSIDYFENIEFAKVTTLIAKDEYNTESITQANKTKQESAEPIFDQKPRINEPIDIDINKVIGNDYNCQVDNEQQEVQIDVINTKTEELEQEQKTINIKTGPINNDNVTLFNQRHDSEFANQSEIKNAINEFKELKNEINNTERSTEKEHQSVRSSFIPTKRITDADEQIEVKPRTVRFSHPTGPSDRS